MKDAELELLMLGYASIYFLLCFKVNFALVIYRTWGLRVSLIHFKLESLKYVFALVIYRTWGAIGASVEVKMF